MIQFWLILLLLLPVSCLAANSAESIGDIVICSHRLIPIDLLGAPQRQNYKEVEAYQGFALLSHLGFRGFAKDFFQYLSSSARPADTYDMYNVWQEAAFGFPPADVEPFRTRLPKGCLEAKARHVLVRQLTPKANLINFDRKILEDLPAHSIERSFILVHEWLSQNFNDGELVRQINQLWHHPDILRSHELIEDFRALIEKGLHQNVVFASVCERSSVIQVAIKYSTLKDCASTSAEDLSRVRTLEIRDFDRKIIDFEDLNLRRIDLTGLDNLEEINFSQARFFSGVIPEGLFSGVPNLRRLTIRDAIKLELSGSFFHGLSHLENLDLRDSFIESLTPGLFEGRFNGEPEAETSLNLGGAQSFQAIPADAFVGLENLKVLNLSGLSSSVQIDQAAFLHLKSLRELDLARSELLAVSTPLTDVELPRLEILNLSGHQRPLEQLGRLSNLRELDLSKSPSSIELSQLDRFPRLRKLDLSATQARIPEGIETLKSLTSLEELNLMSADFWNADNQTFWNVLKSGLPPRLRWLQICRKGVIAQEFFALFSDFRKAHPQLKVAAKTNCEGEWAYAQP